MIKKEFTDKEGFKGLKLLPDESPEIIEYGIDVAIDLREIFPEVPVEFLVKLQNSLFDRGFKEPHDLLKPNAFKEVRSALLSVVGYDANKIIQFYRIGNEE